MNLDSQNLVLGFLRRINVFTNILCQGFSNFFVSRLSNGNSQANFASANFANVGSTRVDVVTCQTRRHSPSRVARTRQTRRHSPSRVVRTCQTCRHSPKAIFQTNVTRLDKFAQVTCKSCEFGVSGHSLIATRVELLPIIYRFTGKLFLPFYR